MAIMPAKGPRKRGQTQPKNQPSPEEVAARTARRITEARAGQLQECLRDGRYAVTLQYVKKRSGSSEEDPFPDGAAISDVMALLDEDRTSCRLILKRLCEYGAIHASGRSHAVRYFTHVPKYHGSEGAKTALLEYARKAKASGFTRAQFLEEFPFSKSTVYQVVSRLMKTHPPLLARRGCTNNMRYYLPEHAPAVQKRKRNQ